MGLVQVITTVGSREDAMVLAHAAVDQRVAACVQVIGAMTSVYRWQETVEEAPEFLCLLKAPLEGLERLVSFVRERHPYDTPEITVVESLFTDERYLAWARTETITDSKRSAKR
jgi:periplasmic divalent cation tolerance protein